MEPKVFQTQYPFMSLSTGDRFYFTHDRKKTVYEMKMDYVDRVLFPLIKTDKEKYFNRPTAKQQSAIVVFLRHKGTQ